MEIKICKESEATLREQLREQIVFQIAIGELKSGEALPSVRSLARRLKIHPNTVSQAYQDLVGDWLVRRQGARLVVRSAGEVASPRDAQDLDDLITSAFNSARRLGFSLRQLRQRFEERLRDQPLDHVLVVGRERALRVLLREELKEGLPCEVESCSPEELSLHPETMVGALVVLTPGIVPEISPLIPRDRIRLPVQFNAAVEHLELIKNLEEPSMIAVISISERFLAAARGLLSPLLGQNHTLREHLMPLEDSDALSVYKHVFCDSIVYHQIKAQNTVQYRLISPDTLEQISSIMKEQ